MTDRTPQCTKYNHCQCILSTKQQTLILSKWTLLYQNTKVNQQKKSIGIIYHQSCHWNLSYFWVSPNHPDPHSGNLWNLAHFPWLRKMAVRGKSRMIMMNFNKINCINFLHIWFNCWEIAIGIDSRNLFEIYSKESNTSFKKSILHLCKLKTVLYSPN